MKIRSVGAELFHADGRTDRQIDTKKLIVDFRNFANAPRNTLFGQSAEFINVTDCDAYSYHCDLNSVFQKTCYMLIPGIFPFAGCSFHTLDLGYVGFPVCLSACLSVLPFAGI